MSELRIAFLMDPLETVIVGHDTTFAIMLECQRRGHEVWCFEQRDLGFRGGRVTASMRHVLVRRAKGDPFDVLTQGVEPLGRFDAVLLRKDPPVDVEYLHATQLADLARSETGRPFLMNEPAGLRDANEKLLALRFPELTPETLVSRNAAAIREFQEEVGGEIVVKPIDGFGGKGIFHLRPGDRNLGAILETSTNHGRDAVIAQRYLPESREGDKRILLLDGEPIGALLRVPSDADARGNLAVGGRAVATELTDRDREICSRVAPELRRRGLHFTGIDVIGAFLTEVNVTSPTGLEEIDSLGGVTIEREIVDFLESRIASLPSAET